MNASMIDEDLMLSIISFLPWTIQLNICHRSRSKIISRLHIAATRIKQMIKRQKSHKIAQLNNESYETQQVLYSIYILYQPLTNIQLDHTLTYILSNRYIHQFPIAAQLTITMGRYLKWPTKKIYRCVLTYFKVNDFIIMGW